MASSRAAELARYDAAERLTYAAIVGDRGAAAEALREQSPADAVAPSIDPVVRDTIVKNDPISAAAAGWLTFQELVPLLEKDPARHLSEVEVEALTDFGPQILRLVVASRLEGTSFVDAVGRHRAGGKSQYALAARGDVQDIDAVAALLAEHGLVPSDEVRDE